MDANKPEGRHYGPRANRPLRGSGSVDYTRIGIESGGKDNRRAEMFERLNARGRKNALLPELRWGYSFYDIAVVTKNYIISFDNFSVHPDHFPDREMVCCR